MAGVLLGVAALLWLSQDPRSANPVVAPAGAAAGNASTLVPQAPRRTGAPHVVAPPPAPVHALVPSRPSARPRPVDGPVLTVLNNSRVSGLAARAATRFRNGGWHVAVIGRFTGRVRATTVYYAPGQRVAAQRLAARFALPRVLPRFVGLPGTGLTVVLTRDAA